VQILNVNDCHWFVASNIIFGDEKLKDSVRIYDSASANVSLTTKKALCSILKPVLNTLHFDIVNVQRQPTSYDCGLFAIAFTTELVFGKDSATCHFDVSSLQPHLLQSFENKFISRFPSKPRRVSFGSVIRKSFAETIHCSCRTVNDPLRPMIPCGSCFRWFHIECVSLDVNKSYESIDWIRSHCNTIFVDFVYFNCIFTMLIMFNTRKSRLATHYSIFSQGQFISSLNIYDAGFHTGKAYEIVCWNPPTIHLFKKITEFEWQLLIICTKNEASSYFTSRAQIFPYPLPAHTNQ